MKVLLLDSKEFGYELIEKEGDLVDPGTRGQKEDMEDVLVGMVAIEKGDGETIYPEVEDDIGSVTKSIGKRTLLLYPYAHLSSELAPASQARVAFNGLYEYLRAKGIDVKKAPFGWNKSFHIRIKGHPMAEQLKTYAAKRRAAEAPKEKFYKYYVIDENGDEYPIDPAVDAGSQPPFNAGNDRFAMLRTFVKNELEGRAAGGKEPSHILNMRKLELVDYCPESDIGNMKWYPNGVLIKDLILDYAFNEVARKWGAIKMQNPLIYRTDVESIRMLQGEFHERDYKIEGEDMVLRFASDPGAFPFVQKVSFSYKQLPFKVYEEATCFRREQKGEVSGLMRVRNFLMTDHHAFCLDERMAMEEFTKLTRIFKRLMDDIIAGGYWVIGFEIVDEYYEKYREFFKSLLKEVKMPAFFKLMNRMSHYYAFKNEFQAVFPDGNNLQISTVQWDVKNGARFSLYFTDADGTRKPVPIIIHASSFGSIERALAAILERASWMEKGGLAPTLPFWLSPEQIRILPISADRHLGYAEGVATKLEEQGLRVGIDDRDLSLSKKMAKAKSSWIPLLVTIGDRELAGGPLSVSKRAGSRIGKEEVAAMTVEELIALSKELQRGMPTRASYLSRYLSKRPVFCEIRE